MRFISLATIASLIALAVSSVTACSPPPVATCMPACRSGFECVRGTCVTSCNPPCTGGLSCLGSGAAARCVSADAAVGDASDAARDGDAGPPLDVTSPSDVTDTMVATDASTASDATDTAIEMDTVIVSDTPAPTDAVAPADGSTSTDVVTMDAPRDSATLDASATDVPRDAPPPCGHAGEACCGGYCAPGNECLATGCHAIVRSPGECTSPSDCPAGQTCQGPTVCGSHGCFQCAAGAGATAFGGTCAANTDCATGLCFRNRCTIACAIGGSGDADCAARSAGYVCTQLNFRTGPTGMTSTVTLGVCRQSCVRNSDCTGGLACLATSNTPADRLDFVCGTSVGTGTAGSACFAPDSGLSDPSRCQSLICIYPATGDLVCTAPCTVNADCPPAASRCVDLSWLRPSGALQPGRACSP